MARRAAMLTVALLASFSLVVDVAPATAQSAASDPYPGFEGRIAFEDDGGIYVMDSDGGNVVGFSEDRISPFPCMPYFPATCPPDSRPPHLWEDGHPAWSPEGTRLAFTSTRDRATGASGLDIYVVDIESRRIDRVTRDGSGGPPAWSPDGRSLVYVGGSDSGIYRVDVSTGVATRLVSRGDGNGLPTPSLASPTFSPDGSRIAFVELSVWASGGGGPPGSPTTPAPAGAIFVMGEDGSNPTRLTSSPSPEGSLVKWTDHDHSPAWSPDGSQIVFSSDRDGGFDLHVMNADGSGRYRLTDEGGGWVGDAAWSPDGTRIAYDAAEGSFVIAVDGSNKMLLPGFNPHWSANGAHIAVATRSGMGVLDADGSNVHVIEPAGFEGRWLPRAGPYWQPVFPPVGVVDPTAGVWRLWDWGGRSDRFYYGNPGDVPFVGDWDCDGADTPGLYRQSDGFVYLRHSNTEGIADKRFFFGNPDDVPLAGDFDGDGCDTVGVYRPSEQRFYVINHLGSAEGGLGAADFSFEFGNPGDVPVVGDWDGDGTDETGLQRPSIGLFYWRNTLTSGAADGQTLFGDPGDRLVAWDWDGDGFDTLAVYRPGTGTVYFRNTLADGVAEWRYRLGEDAVPIAGRLAR